jgi:Protein of unknown function (DUF2917)
MKKSLVSTNVQQPSVSLLHATENHMKATQVITNRSLARGELMKLAGGCGLALEVGAGMVWLTTPGSKHDLLVGRGDRVPLNEAGLTLAEAVRPADVRIVAVESCTTSIRLVLGRLLAKARGWLHPATA